MLNSIKGIFRIYIYRTLSCYIDFAPCRMRSIACRESKTAQSLPHRALHSQNRILCILEFALF